MARIKLEEKALCGCIVERHIDVMPLRVPEDVREGLQQIVRSASPIIAPCEAHAAEIKSQEG